MNILVIKNRALGDSIIGLGAIAYLKKILPDAHIVYGVPAWILPLYNNITTAADDYQKLKFSSLWDWICLWWILRRKHFDLVIEMHQSGRSGGFFRLFCRLQGIPYYYHNHNLLHGNFVFDQGKRRPAVQRDLDGIYSAVCHMKSKDLELPHYLDWRPTIQLENQALSNKIILGVVATRPTKMWPLVNYKQLCDKLLRADNSLQIIIPLSDSVQDQRIEKKLVEMQLDRRVQIVRDSLARLPHTLAGARIYLGNDTGLKHLCVALNIKTYTFFGPEEPYEWHPYDVSFHEYFYYEEMPCRIEKSHFCGRSECDNHICLELFSVEEVFERLSSFLFRV